MHSSKHYLYSVLCLFSLLLPLHLSHSTEPPDTKKQESPAVTTYKQFTNAFITGQFDKARNLSAKQAREVVDKKSRLVQQGKDKIIPILEPIFVIFKETPTKDGKQMQIEGMQLVQGDVSKGAEPDSDMHRQSVTLEKMGNEWKVVIFKDDAEPCCQ